MSEHKTTLEWGRGYGNCAGCGAELTEEPALVGIWSEEGEGTVSLCRTCVVQAFRTMPVKDAEGGVHLVLSRKQLENLLENQEERYYRDAEDEKLGREVLEALRQALHSEPRASG
jgi:hypothetical protein